MNTCQHIHNGTLRALFVAVLPPKGEMDLAAAYALADYLQELGEEVMAVNLQKILAGEGGLKQGYEHERLIDVWRTVCNIKQICLQRGLLRWEDEPGQQQALAFQAALEAVDLGAVPVMTTDRLIDRKEQVHLLRQLLKQLKVPHVRVTTPNYSRASGVKVALPHRKDYPLDCPNAKAAKETEAGRRNTAAWEKFERLLLRAFHDNRSHPRHAHSDYCWCLRAK